MKRIVVLLTALAFTAPAVAQDADWQKTWNETLSAAKQEGKVVVMGSPDPVMRNEVVAKFAAKYGIQIEYIAGQSGPLAERVKIERASGIYAADVFMPGAGTAYFTLLPENIIDPLKPLLLLPEVTDGSKWKFGKPRFGDAAGQNVLMLFRNVDSLLFINAGYVKPEEMTKPEDLLDPKWQGKIGTADPLASGIGSDLAAYFYTEIGPNFVKKLYIDQKPMKSQDRRQLMDWLARGSNPICLTCKIESAGDLQKEGFKILELFDFKGLRKRVTSSPFVLTYANRAPHPNAARIFINWMATREALEIYSRGNGTATLRTDVDESFLNPNIIPRRDEAYFEASEGEWITKGRQEATEKVRELIKNSK